MTLEPFALLSSARLAENSGWPITAALLYEYEQAGLEWWLGHAETEAEALRSPEIQLPKTTRNQYVAIWHAFKDIPPAELERVRPRLLFQTVASVEAGVVTAQEAMHDALSLDWLELRKKYGHVTES